MTSVEKLTTPSNPAAIVRDRSDLRRAAPRAHAIAFDVEGTLIDCVPQTIACWHQTLADHGFDFSYEELHRYSGMDPELMLARLLPDRDEALEKSLLDQQGERYREKFLPTVKPFPGGRALFSALASDGHRLGLATTCQPDELRVYLRLLDITDYVSAAVCGDDVQREKPAPDLVELAGARLAAETLAGLYMVGDTPYDAAAGLGAGAKPVGTLGGGFSADELIHAGCVDVAANPIELLPLLRSLTEPKQKGLSVRSR